MAESVPSLVCENVGWLVRGEEPGGTGDILQVYTGSPGAIPHKIKSISK